MVVVPLPTPRRNLVSVKLQRTVVTPSLPLHRQVSQNPARPSGSLPGKNKIHNVLHSRRPSRSATLASTVGSYRYTFHPEAEGDRYVGVLPTLKDGVSIYLGCDRCRVPTAHVLPNVRTRDRSRVCSNYGEGDLRGRYISQSRFFNRPHGQVYHTLHR